MNIDAMIRTDQLTNKYSRAEFPRLWFGGETGLQASKRRAFRNQISSESGFGLVFRLSAGQQSRTAAPESPKPPVKKHTKATSNKSYLLIKLCVFTRRLSKLHVGLLFTSTKEFIFRKTFLSLTVFCFTGKKLSLPQIFSVLVKTRHRKEQSSYCCFVYWVYMIEKISYMINE